MSTFCHSSPTAIEDNPRVFMLTAPNPGPKTLDGTHTYIVGDSDVFIIDPGPNVDSHLAAMCRYVDTHGLRPQAIMLTHTHPDHADGAASLGHMLHIPVLASTHVSDNAAVTLGIDDRFGHGKEWHLGSDLLRALESPGHTLDHMMFWMPRNRILFAGDTILGRGTSVIAPPEGNMRSYLATLDMVRRLDPRLIAPGHGPLVDQPRQVIARYIQHRQEREEQILAALYLAPGTSSDLVRRVYTDIGPELYNLAERSMEAQLQKLEHEGRVESIAHPSRATIYRLSTT